MTEKELLYFEDAIGHEQNTIAYIEYAISTLDDDKLIEFMNKELNNHEIVQNKLLGILEDNTNE